MKHKYFYCLLLLLLCTSLASCDQGHPFKIIDTGIIAGARLTWVDNNKILYVEEVVSRSVENSKKNKSQRNLILLDLFSLKKQLVFEDMRLYCFNQGRLVVATGHRQDTKYFFGNLDKQNEYEVPYDSYVTNSCRVKENFAKKNNRYWKDLPNDYGYLDKGQRTPNGSPRNLRFTYVPNDTPNMLEAVYLDAAYSDMVLNGGVFFEDKIFFNSTNKVNLRDKKGTVYRYGYWFDAPDSLKKTLYKVRKKTKNVPVYFYPVKNDRAVVRMRIYTHGMPNYALSVSPDYVESTLLKGRIDHVSVSPNGCVVAFIHSNLRKLFQFNQVTKKTLKYFNACISH